MNTELQNKALEILLKELKPGGILHTMLGQNLLGQDKKIESPSEQVNAKLKKDEGRENLLEYMIQRQKETQKKYETALFGLVDLVERFGGDSGAMMNWNATEFIKNAEPEEVIENVYKQLRELEEDSEQRATYRLADALIYSSKSGKITNQSIIKCLKEYYPNMNVSLLMDAAKGKKTT